MSFVKSIFNFLRFNNKNWKAVVLCIVAATVFWFFNALNKNYAASITFPVVFEYNPEQYWPLEKLPPTVRMNVSGTGWELFRRSSGFKVPALTIPLEKPVEVKKIVGSTLPALFASQLEKLQINFVLTDTLRVSFDEKFKRKFTVVLDSVQQYLHPDVGLTSAVTITPDTVWFEGPKQFIKSLPPALQLPLQQHDIRKDFREAVVLPYKNVIQTPSSFMVSFQVAEFTEVHETIALTVVDKPAHLKSNIVQHITCTYAMPGTDVAAPRSLQAVLDLSGLSHGTHKLVPQITGLPQYTRLIKTDTVIVNF